jgi:hypothetical protein
MPRHAVILAAALAWLIGIESAEAKLDILVDKATQRMLVIQDGYMRYIWPVSTGRDETSTPNGVYTPQRLERNWFSTAYYSSPMPYSIFFHNGYAIHGSYAIDRLGGPASHGCVRLHPHHAALLFDLVQQEGPNQTTIEITDEGGPGAPSLPPREIAAARDLEPSVPGIVRARPDGPQLPAREIPAERGLYPPVPGIVRARPDGLPLPAREIPAERGMYPPVPGIVRYREIGDMPELPPAQRGNRPIAAKNPLPPLRPPPASRRLLSEVRLPANAPRAPCGPGEADSANGAPRQSGESSDCRPKPKVAEASPPEQAQQAPSNNAFKLLPSSCWFGGASRWRWWGSSQGTPCR